MRHLPGQRLIATPEPTRHDRAHAARIGCPVDEYVAQRLAGFKWCSYGQHWEHPEKFSVCRREKDGRATTCKKHQAEYWQRRKRNRTREGKA